ncbi:organic hydroperoxide resistance protein [Nocardioides caricicola]|uniref:Organic hydroperoxide resistance protein n=1 Tax=Nocardioides caricicola TaxID=634770 RepID=A0ABW0N2S3_9ACTN
MAHMNSLYTASVAATGDGRNGHVQSTDGVLDLDVRLPRELGGSGDAANPELLFAAGYAACFHSALRLVAGQAKVDTTDSEVVADVSLGSNDAGGFQLAVRLEVSVPNADEDVVRQLVEQAHQVCPYSNATRGNIDVAIDLA